MTISSLVITMDPARSPDLERSLSRHRELELGCVLGHHLPAVLITDDLRSSAEFAKRLTELEGVLSVDVVRVDLLDDAECGEDAS